MLRPLLTALVLSGTGYTIWTVRRGWRHKPEHVFMTSLILQSIGFMLCAPVAHHWHASVIFPVTHIANLNFFFGNVCFIAAAVATIYGVAYRLMPDVDIPYFIRRTDWVAAATIGIMLFALTASPTSRHPHPSVNFLNLQTDDWLKLYWIAYGSAIIYMLGYLTRLLIVLRRDPRSKISAYLFLFASIVGIIGIGIAVANALFDWSILDPLLWTMLCVPSALAVAAAVWRSTAKLRSRP